MNRRVTLSILLIQMSFGLLNAQHSLSGKVLDDTTKEPLVGASVFLAKSTYGTSTDTEGFFRIKNLRPGKYNVVVSFVGFETVVFECQSDQANSFTIMMKPAVSQLKSITIYANKRNNWEKDLRTFKKYFIGTSENSTTCAIKNAKVLSFSKKAGLFTASADSVLIVENWGLGFRIKFLLEEYKYDLRRNTVYFRAQSVFEKLKPKNEEEAKRWATNRLKAYHGSDMHFMRALCDNRLIEEGFLIRVSSERLRKGKLKLIAEVDTTVTFQSPFFPGEKISRQISRTKHMLDTLATKPQIPVISFKGQVDVIYIHETEPFAYQMARKLYKTPKVEFQQSQLLLSKPQIQIDGNGSTDSEGVVTRGYWSWQLVSESLPVDYDPMEDERILSGFRDE